ncbi:endoplasmic reticulum mannosyl-oligosaccharide 1,2-alpha-mannosidase [Nannospalax galili]|uniref:endoplasmic reticulum mannosyl-oligosaccharide 1,2-alpha-mannosidase n=1 Tax=Nannospalax galili TaxID=1026970 RepID=UPI00081A21AD|nr:endoplasmic reticulum mannosyl-oligosaccharide 1,2-alpha-mannosidase [Nannospalax galili]
MPFPTTSFSLTLIDALDTLLILGNISEFQRVVEVLQDNVDFDIDVNASVFETNIRGEGCLRGPVGEKGLWSCLFENQESEYGLQNPPSLGTGPKPVTGGTAAFLVCGRERAQDPSSVSDIKVSGGLEGNMPELHEEPLSGSVNKKGINSAFFLITPHSVEFSGMMEMFFVWFVVLDVCLF